MRTPKEFSGVWAIGDKFPKEPMALTFSKERGFFEPITNSDAAPVIGKIISWQYRGETDEDDTRIWDSMRK